jgi:3,4-dihydroxy 2-butanone 4-phosphate synthase/GTP cyclohydrolase II
MNEDGSMARVGDLQAYCFKHGLRMITIADLIAYRRRNDKLIERVVATTLPRPSATSRSSATAR